jgi:two-component sensor histidine kinase
MPRRGINIAYGAISRFFPEAAADMSRSRPLFDLTGATRWWTMSNSISAHETIIQFPRSRTVARSARERERLDAVTAELQVILSREKSLRTEIGDLLQQQNTLTLEFEHRLVSGLKMIESLLLLQCRAAGTSEAAEQLSLAARRVGAVGRLHRRPDLLAQ